MKKEYVCETCQHKSWYEEDSEDFCRECGQPDLTKLDDIEEE